MHLHYEHWTLYTAPSHNMLGLSVLYAVLCCAAKCTNRFQVNQPKKKLEKKAKKKYACRLIIIPFGFMCAGRMSRYMCLFVQCNVFLVCVYIEWNQCESNECLLCEILTLIRRFNSEQYTRTEVQDKERENTTWKKASNLSTQFGVCVCVWSEKNIITLFLQIITATKYIKCVPLDCRWLKRSLWIFVSAILSSIFFLLWAGARANTLVIERHNVVMRREAKKKHIKKSGVRCEIDTSLMRPDKLLCDRYEVCERPNSLWVNRLRKKKL